ncbi:MAG TPA: glycosyltransferase family 4 protein [Dissulfurispiraceae bacterium]|nr:glycosyltransferase family 4 protein [Dissulfurispiraceae bacterium]
MKILGVIDGAPFDYKTWSGSSSYFFNALKEQGCLYDAIAAEPGAFDRYRYKLLSFQSDMKKWKFKYHLNTGFYEQRSQAAIQRIEMLDNDAYDIILQIGAWYDLTHRKDKRTVSYHDGNLQTLLHSPYGYPRIAQSYIWNTIQYEKELYHKMDHIFTMSGWLADSFINDFGVPHQKITPVGAGINLPYIQRLQDKHYEEPNILFVGRDFERKGGKQLLEAFAIVRKEIRKARLTIIGPDLSSTPEGVRCLGFVPKSSKSGISLLLREYAAASLFVLPSLYEPFGISFAEAMAHCLPCIGTNICAMPEIVDQGINGYVVPPGDADALSKYMIDLLKQPEKCRRMGEAGYRKYENNYTWDSVTGKIVAILSR